MASAKRPTPRQPLPSPPEGERDRVRGFARQMRHEPSVAESRLWRELRGRRFGGWKFRRQHVVSDYILDFYCPAARIAVELDGGQHGDDMVRQRGEERTRVLQRSGISVLRYWNDLVLRQTDDVLEDIEKALLAHTPSPRPAPLRGEGVARKDASDA